MNTKAAERIEIDGMSFVPFIDEKTLEDRVKELAVDLESNFKGKNPVFIGVLNGSFMFLGDLMKFYSEPCEVDFLKISSYGRNITSSGVVKLKKDIDVHAEGRHIILVEDIIDTGLSISFLIDRLMKQNPASISVVTLLLKPESIKYKHKIDYIGFEIPSKFVLGYGLDYDQHYRNLRSVYILEDEKTSEK